MLKLAIHTLDFSQFYITFFNAIIMIYFLLFKKKVRRVGGRKYFATVPAPPKVIPKLHACSSFF